MFIYKVTISRAGFGRFTGGSYDTVHSFRNREKARDFYTDYLIKYANAPYTITFEEGESN